jgi:hypothetical protein
VRLANCLVSVLERLHHAAGPFTGVFDMGSNVILAMWQPMEILTHTGDETKTFLRRCQCGLHAHKPGANLLGNNRPECLTRTYMIDGTIL